MNPEVTRFLSYMAAFSKPSDRKAVAVLMDKMANNPEIGSQITANRSNEFGVPYATAQLAFQAVEYVEGGAKPHWLTQAGIEE